MNKFCILALLLFGLINLQAQDISYGFKAGLTFNTISGPSETDNAGNELEQFNYGTGFNIGIIGNVKLTDYFGVRGELMYAQKGVEYRFEGPSYFFFDLPTNEEIVSTGQRTIFVDVTNSYIDLPLLGYAKFGRFEIMGGVNAGVLIASVGDGSLNFTGTTPNGTPISDLEFQLDYNFIGDGPGEVGDNPELITLNIDGRNVEVPRSIGAYYDYAEDQGNLFNRFDFGVVGGISLYLNSGLFLNGRINYGLVDVTNDEVDVSNTEVNTDGSLINRSDDDRNLVIQTSIGFRF